MESAQASDGSDTYLQAAGPNFLVLSSWKVNIAENPIAVGVVDTFGLSPFLTVSFNWVNAAPLQLL